MLMHALFIPSDVIADAILSRISAGSPSASMSCTLCGPSPQCTVTALGASTPRLARVRLPRARRRGSRPRSSEYFAGWPWRRRVAGARDARRRRAASSAGRPARRWRWRGSRARTRRCPKLKPHCLTTSPDTMSSGATGWVVAFTPRRLTSGCASARIALEHHREVLGRAAGEHRVHRHDAPRDHARAGRQHRRAARRGRRRRARAWRRPAPGVGGTRGRPSPQPCCSKSANIASGSSVGELQETIGVDGGHARCAGYRG